VSFPVTLSDPYNPISTMTNTGIAPFFNTSWCPIADNLFA